MNAMTVPVHAIGILELHVTGDVLKKSFEQNLF